MSCFGLSLLTMVFLASGMVTLLLIAATVCLELVKNWRK